MVQGIDQREIEGVMYHGAIDWSESNRRIRLNILFTVEESKLVDVYAEDDNYSVHGERRTNIMHFRVNVKLGKVCNPNNLDCKLFLE